MNQRPTKGSLRERDHASKRSAFPVALPIAGFTLVELMVTIVIAGILLMIAVPSFVSLTQTNRVAAEINGLSASLQFARAEAVKEGLPVTVCVSTTGTGCAAASTPWQSGWIVFSDANGNQTVNPGDLVLRRGQLLDGELLEAFRLDGGQDVPVFGADVPGLTDHLEVQIHIAVGQAPQVLDQLGHAVDREAWAGD